MQYKEDVAGVDDVVVKDDVVVIVDDNVVGVYVVGVDVVHICEW